MARCLTSGRRQTTSPLQQTWSGKVLIRVLLMGFKRAVLGGQQDPHLWANADIVQLKNYHSASRVRESDIVIDYVTAELLQLYNYPLRGGESARNTNDKVVTRVAYFVFDLPARRRHGRRARRVPAPLYQHLSTFLSFLSHHGIIITRVS